MTAPTPRHARRIQLPMPRRNGHTQVQAAVAAAIRWEPQPLPSELGDQARRELAALAGRRDVWAGTRDTDRSL